MAQEVETALEKPMAHLVEDAVREARASHVLRPPEEELRREWQTAEADSAQPEEPPVVDVSSRHDQLAPLSPEMQESLDRQEVPEALGGDGHETTTTATATVAAEAATTATTAAEAAAEAAQPTGTTPPSPAAAAADHHRSDAPVAAVEVTQPRVVWTEKPPAAAAAEEEEEEEASQVARRAIRVSRSEGPVHPNVEGEAANAPHVLITLLLTENVVEPLSLLKALHISLDAAEQLVRRGTDTDMTGASRAPGGAHQPSAVLELSTLPHCDFFVPARNPLELSPPLRRQYEMEKSRLLSRLHRYHHDPQRLWLRCVATACNAVTDLGAEIFFACRHRRLCGGLDAVDGSQLVVGFPSLCQGLFPSMHTLKCIRASHGTQVALEWLPQLHRYDPISLESAGLAAVMPQPPRDGGHETHGRKAWGPSGSVTWSVWVENLLLSKVCGSPRSRQQLLDHVLLPARFKKARRAASVDPIIASWYDYGMAAVTTMDEASPSVPSALGGLHEAVCLPRLMSLATSAAGVCAASTVRHLDAIKRRTYAPAPNTRFLAFKAQDMDQWEAKAAALAAAAPTGEGPAEGVGGATALFDCSPRCIGETLAFVKRHRTATFDGFHQWTVLLVGSEATARPLRMTLPCATVIAPVSCVRFGGAPLGASLQQVRTFARRDWPPDLQDDSLSAALTYLQQHQTPYVVAGTPAAQRLLCALVFEAMRLGAVCDPAMIERAAVESLGLVMGPLRLMDAYGIPRILSMLEEVEHWAALNEGVHGEGGAAASSPTALSPLPYRGADALRRMVRDGFTGASGIRGGFYGPTNANDRGEEEEARERGLRLRGGRLDGPGGAGELQDYVLRSYVGFGALTLRELADCLLAVVVNTSCALLTERSVAGAADIGLLTIAALGWRPSGGGALAAAEARPGGLKAMAERMTELSLRYGEHLAPHPLLVRIARSGLSFSSVDNAEDPQRQQQQ